MKSRITTHQLSKTRRALVVEPTAALARLLHEMLRQLGFEVEVVAAPEDAFSAAEVGPPFDLLVTELSLPEISGRTVAGFMSSRRPQTVVLYLCDALARPSIEKHGAVALDKPFSLEDLSNALQHLFAEEPV